MTQPLSANATVGASIALRRVGDRKVFPVTADCIVGRVRQADICIDNEAGISRKHARIRQEGSTHLLLDLGSLNGTTVNGQLLESATPIEIGDIIVFDQQRFEVIPWVDVAGSAQQSDADAPTRIADPGEASDPALIRPAIRVVDNEQQFLDDIDREWSAAASAPSHTHRAPLSPETRRRWPVLLPVAGAALVLIGLSLWMWR